MLAARPSLAATSTDIKLFSVESGAEVRRLIGHVWRGPALAFTPSGTQLASTGADQTVRIWNVRRAEQRIVLHGHLSETYRAAVSSDGDTIVSGAKDGSILAWNAKHVERRNRFNTLPISVSQIAFVPNSRELFADDPDGNVTVWDSEALQPLGVEASPRHEVKKLFVSPDGTRVQTLRTRCISGGHGHLARSRPKSGDRIPSATRQRLLESDWRNVALRFICVA
jgi:WD40 repeat protein